MIRPIVGMLAGLCLLPLTAQAEYEYYDTEVTTPTGDTIVMTVFKPSGFVPGQKYPLVLNASGFGQTRPTRPAGMLGPLAEIAPMGTRYGDLRAILDAGMGVLAFDHRGMGDSSGKITLMDPDVEVANLVAIVDWAEDNLSWLQHDAAGNLLLGATGGSYGGAYQWLLAMYDPKKRLDAIVPQMTWHDLDYGLAPSGVAKSAWLSLFYVADGAALEPYFKSAVTTAIRTGNMPADVLEALRARSLSAYCEGDRGSNGQPLPAPPKVDTLLLQGQLDVMFDINEAYRSYQCLSATGADVRLATYQFGHILPSSPSIVDPVPLPLSNFFGCGGMTAERLEVAWLRAKLKGESALISDWPKMCLSLNGGGDYLFMDDLPIGGTHFDLPKRSVSNNLLGWFPDKVHLLTASTEVDVVGIPTATIKIADPIFGTWAWGDPIVFVALGKNGAPIDDQVLPVRGYGTHHIDLKAVAERLEPGDKLQLLYFASHIQYFSADNDPLLPLVRVSGSVNVPLQ